MTFRDFSALCAELERTRPRLIKIGLVAEFLKRLAPSEVSTAVAFLSARPLPHSDPRVLEVSGSTLARLTREAPTDGARAEAATVELTEVRAEFEAVAEASGSGSRASKLERLQRLFARVTPSEREWLARILFGEMRTGVSDGLVLEAIARAAGTELEAVRRAAMFLGDPGVVAELALSAGAAGLAGVTPRLFVPMLPMMAEIATDFAAVLDAHRGRTAMEVKYDGARIQLHRDGARVGIWSRRLSDVTASLPDVVEIAQRDLAGGSVILDGEVVALGEGGRPLPFQELMRRFRRVHGIDTLVRDVPLALYFFDCLVRDGRSLIDMPYEARWSALEQVTNGRYLAMRTIVADAAAAEAFMAAALATGHEGVMAKDLASAYSPGGRGKRWFKIKAPATVDCVIIAADRGSGRRTGWLSNYHLAVRDGEGYGDVGKTFKGLTDKQFVEMTERLRALALEDDGYTVRVTPRIVVEVAYNDIQRSPRYPSGLALRFARITRVRDDKAPGQATTLGELQALYEQQFATKSRVTLS